MNREVRAVFMADFRNRHPASISGKFYVDILCLDCVVCREFLPTVFRRDDVNNSSYVFRQPTTPEEIELCEESLRRCPCQAIGDDGDQHDWAVPPDKSAHEELRKEPGECEAHEEKRRWKFW